LRMTLALRQVAVTVADQGDDAGASLVVSHGGAMRVFLLAVTGTMPPPLENGAVFRLRMTSAAGVGGMTFDAIERIV